MKQNESVLYKIWMVIYPLILYFLLDVLIVWAVQFLILLVTGAQPGSFLGYNTPTIAAMIFLIVSIVIFWKIYQRDYVESSVWIQKKPGYIALLVLIGILASHGLSALISLMEIDNIAGNYTELENEVFAASPVLVIIQIVILAPLSEELLFRGILYNRLQKYLRGFWLPALISSAIFGVYHFNLAQGIFAFLFGLLLCAVYDKVRNLWACVALHVGGNLISTVLTYAGFTYPKVWICIVSLVITLAAAWALYHFLIRPVKKYTV